MDHLFLRSTSAEALRAELHRSDLLREAATSRRVRAASAGPTSKLAAGPGFVSRVRTAFAGLGPARPGRLRGLRLAATGRLSQRAATIRIPSSMSDPSTRP